MVEDEITYAIQYTCEDLATLRSINRNLQLTFRQTTIKNTKVNLALFVQF